MVNKSKDKRKILGFDRGGKSWVAKTIFIKKGKDAKIKDIIIIDCKLKNDN